MMTAVASTNVHSAVHADCYFALKIDRHISKLPAEQNHVSRLPLADLGVEYFRASISQTEQTCSG